MKHDADIDTEKYSSHNIHNNIKKNSVSSVAKINIMAASHDAVPWGFIDHRDAIRHRKGVMGQWVDKKISYYTFPPANCKFPSLSCTLPPSK